MASELHDEELQVLESIYPDYILACEKDTVKLEIPVELGAPRRISVTSFVSNTGDTDSISEIKISYLPPVLLTIQLPDTYPLQSPPTISTLHVTHTWLPRELGLLECLNEQWLEGEGVLCNWVESIRSGDFLEKLGLVDTNGDIRLPCPGSQAHLSQLLTNYNGNASNKEFSQNSHPCSLCLTSVKGARCIQLSCSHVFCRTCLQEYWSFCISEGSVEKVGCADPACVKESIVASEEEVRRVVTEREVMRWKWLRTKKAIEKDPTIIHCPIPGCQEPVPMPSIDAKASSGWSKFRSCLVCGFNFCSFCKHTWHGLLSGCPRSVVHDVVMEYLNLPEGSPERTVIERKFGASTIKRLVNQYEEEKQTEDLLKRSTTACPKCHVHIEKSLGCNHMCCVKCQQHFCYRCGTKLNALDPYAHFSADGTGCYGKLFDIDQNLEEDGWQAIEWIDEL